MLHAVHRIKVVADASMGQTRGGRPHARVCGSVRCRMTVALWVVVLLLALSGPISMTLRVRSSDTSNGVAPSAQRVLLSFPAPGPPPCIASCGVQMR